MSSSPQMPKLTESSPFGVFLDYPRVIEILETLYARTYFNKEEIKKLEKELGILNPDGSRNLTAEYPDADREKIRAKAASLKKLRTEAKEISRDLNILSHLAMRMCHARNLRLSLFGLLPDDVIDDLAKMTTLISQEYAPLLSPSLRTEIGQARFNQLAQLCLADIKDRDLPGEKA